MLKNEAPMAATSSKSSGANLSLLPRWHGCPLWPYYLGPSWFSKLWAPHSSASRSATNKGPEKLAFFLNQVWTNLDDYVPAYLLDIVMVNAVATNLEGEAMEWVMRFHGEDMPALGKVYAWGS